VVKLVAVRIDRRDRHGNAPRFGGDSMRCTVECRIKRGLPAAIVRASEIGDDQAHVVHFRHGDKQICQCGGGHDAEIGIAHGHGDGVGQVRREFIKEQHQRIATEQLLPGLRPWRTEQGRNVAGKLLGFAELLGNRTPDATGGIGAAAIEAGNTSATEIRRGVLLAQQHPFPQLRITRQQPQRDHAVRLAAAHGLREQEDRRTRTRTAQVTERPIHQRQHAIGEVVLLEEFRAIDLAFEESVEVENRGAAVSGEY
jgi:hypothetical protein